MEVPKGGAAPATLAMASPSGSPSGIAVNAASVYWTDSTTVMSVPIVSGPTVTLASGQLFPGPIALDPTSVYWADSSTVMKAPLDGGAPVTLVTVTGAAGSADGVAVDGENVYWTQSVNTSSGLAGDVMSMPLDGGAATTLTPSGWVLGPRPQLAVDPTGVYVSSDVLFRLPPDGGAPITLASGVNTANFAVDGAHVYWISNGDILRVDIAGGTPITVLPSRSPTCLAVDDTSLYFTEGLSGTVMKLTPK